MAKTEAERKRARLAAALRENLKRRKAHKRGEAPAKNGSAARPNGSEADALSRPKPGR